MNTIANHAFPLTIDVIVACVEKPGAHNDFGGREKLAFVNIAMVGIPRVPAQAWDFALYFVSVLVYPYLTKGMKSSLTVTPSGITIACAVERRRARPLQTEGLPPR